MKNKNKIKIFIDIIMLILLISLMNIEFIGMKSHEIVGITIFILFIIHKVLNMKLIGSYFKNLLNKKFKKRYKVLFLLDCLLFLFMVGIIITGIFISNYIFKDIFIGNIGTYKKIHKFFSWWFLVFVSIHLGFHLNTATAFIKNKYKNLNQNKLTIVIGVVLYVLISLNGIKVIANENVYKSFIPNFTVNYYGRLENDTTYTYRGSESNRKYKNRQNRINNMEKNDIHINNTSLIDITSIIVLFAGGTYFILKAINKKRAIALK